MSLCHRRERVPEEDAMLEKILVIDDSRSFRLSLLRFLEMEGYEVLGAEDGLVGLETIRRATPDLVLMDINMPHLDGLEALRLLREFSHVPVLILSARMGEMDRVKGQMLGADFYLTKPFSASELLDRIEVTLHKDREAKSKGVPREKLGGRRGTLMQMRAS